MTTPMTHSPVYPNLPTSALGWSQQIEPVIDAYWKARRDGCNETAAMLLALDLYAKERRP